jgi:hypothetical protein
MLEKLLVNDKWKYSIYLVLGLETREMFSIGIDKSIWDF